MLASVAGAADLSSLTQVNVDLIFALIIIIV